MEASPSHMTRSATEARSRASAEWIASHVRSTRRYRPLPGRILRRQHLHSTRKELAGRYYQSLSGYGSFGSYLKDKKEGRLGRVMVVRHRRAPVQVPPRGQVLDLGRPDASYVEEDSEAMREERPWPRR